MWRRRSTGLIIVRVIRSIRGVLHLKVQQVLQCVKCLKDHAFDRTHCLRSIVIMPLMRSVVEC